MSNTFSFEHPYTVDANYNVPVAYLCMEFALHQPLKIYAGGLGFLAGSYLRSAFELQQNVVGVGILWKYGYYDQTRKSDQSMEVLFQEKVYGFLKPTNIKFTISVSNHDVWVTAYYLPPTVFNSAPLFLLSTDLPENDYLAHTISHRLYDSNPETKIAASILLGIGGCKLFEFLNWKPDVIHLNESHALPAAFYMHNKYKDTLEVKKRVVFTNHTPEEGGNPKTNIWHLEKMGFFCNVPLTEIRALTGISSDLFDHTLACLRMAKLTNAVSKTHLTTLNKIWGKQQDISPMISVTNAQNYSYWADKAMYKAMENNQDDELKVLKMQGKQRLFEVVADQNGEIFDPAVFTIVFAKRFTGYKRPDLLMHDPDRFHRLMTNKERPVQIIWAGKPYPADYAMIGIFDKIVNICKQYPNCAVLAGYELRQSRLLKSGADLWLNVPRIGHEASGTSGMSAAMNGAVNFSIPDGWVPEFAKDKSNCFLISPGDPGIADFHQDEADAAHMYEQLEKEIIPMYYDYPSRWMWMVKNSMRDVIPQFDSNRLVDEYYRKMYML